MVELVHVSDTHLGYQAYSHLSKDGLNQREVDFQDAFRRVVDAVLERPPDLVVHSGDLFDAVRPSNRAIAFALEQARRLSGAGIPLALVSGNHEAPRMRETGSILRVFRGIPGVYPVFAAGYERVRIETRGGAVVFHGVPQMARQSDFAEELARAEPGGNGTQVLATHGTVSGVAGLFMGEWNELSIPENALRPDYDYIALGHFHNHRVLRENAAYAGSTERTSFAEASEEKVVVRVEAGGGRPRIAPVVTGARPMRDAGVLEARRWGTELLREEIRQRLESVATEGSLVRLRVRDVEPSVLRTLDVDALRRAAARALHLDLRLEAHVEAASAGALPELGSLAAEFDAFVARRPLEGVDRDALRARARRYLGEAEESSRAA